MIELPVQKRSGRSMNWNCAQHQLFGEARQVHHRQRGGGAEFDGEVAIGDAVQRVAANLVKAQQFCGDLTLDRVGGAGQRG
jgi:hypothetical protein